MILVATLVHPGTVRPAPLAATLGSRLTASLVLAAALLVHQGTARPVLLVSRSPGNQADLTASLVVLAATLPRRGMVRLARSVQTLVSSKATIRLGGPVKGRGLPPMSLSPGSRPLAFPLSSTLPATSPQRHPPMIGPSSQRAATQVLSQAIRVTAVTQAVSMQRRPFSLSLTSHHGAPAAMLRM